MLSDRERETLRRVEGQFAAEDPRFVRSFDASDADASSFSLQWAHQLPRWVYTVALAASVNLGLLMLLTGAPVAALACAVVATMVHEVRRRRDDADTRDRSR